MIKKRMNKFLTKEVMSYLFFGVLTTLVNFMIYELCKFFGLNYQIANGIAWITSVIFAYITNKLFVFKSRNLTWNILLKEFISFIACRLLSGAFDMGFLIIAVEFLHINDVVAKIGTAVFVVIINYVFSKLLIFKDKKQKS